MLSLHELPSHVHVEAFHMARMRKNALPKYVELNARNQTYYFDHPALPRKLGLGKIEREAVRLASQLNARHLIQRRQDAARLESLVSLGGVRFSEAFGAFPCLTSAASG